METPLLLIIALWLHDTTDIEAYRAFERKAATIMADHGGRIERVIRMTRDPEKPHAPFEYHIVGFPDAAAFERYASDPRTIDLAEERAALIRHTEIIKGHDVEIP